VTAAVNRSILRVEGEAILLFNLTNISWNIIFSLNRYKNKPKNQNSSAGLGDADLKRGQ
jgi:hypothetical protein